MQLVRRKTKEIITYFSFFSVGAVFIVEFLFIGNGITVASIFSALGHVGSLIGLLWLVWNNWAWKWKCFKKWSIPDISGRWEGYYERKEGNGKHKYVVEIQQTYVSVFCSTFQDNDTSSGGVVAELCEADNGMRYFFVFFWEGTTSYREERFPVGTSYKGLTQLQVFPQNTTRKAKLGGVYFTNRSSTGSVEVQFIGKQLQGRL